MVYYISEIRNTDENCKTAGSKARIDVEYILNKYCKELINTSTIYAKKNKFRKFIDVLKLNLRLHIKKNRINSDDILFIQYPLYYLQDLIVYYAKKTKVVLIIHDLEFLRQKDEKKNLKNQMNLLMKCHKVISHNSKMSSYLINMGIDKNKIVNLQLFDYLVPDPHRVNNSSKNNLICYAGNLNKSKFIYELKLNNDFKLALYGIGFKETDNKFINYYGSFEADKIPYVLNGKYGLVWDGDSIINCNNNFAKYLKYNTPHKVSLYIAASIPIVIWKEAALASFIVKNNIGIAVDSLENLDKILNQISQKQYIQMKKNIEIIRQKIVNGEMMKNALFSITNISGGKG